jgi:hypothetical protein
MAVRKNPIDEAKRYMENAREILSEKAKKDGNYYSDPKYVKMAGNTAWNGVLVALDGVLDIKKQGSRKDFNDYKNAAYKKDRKMTRLLQGAYESLHLYMGYDGGLNYKIVQAGLEEGKSIINWATKHYKA